MSRFPRFSFRKVGRDQPEQELDIKAVPDYTEFPCDKCAGTGLLAGSECPECEGVGVVIHVWAVTIYQKHDPRGESNG